MLLIYCKDPRCKPERQFPSDAGLDLKAAQTTILTHGTTIVVPCGVHIEVPIGYTGLIFPRSGLASKHGVTLANSVGVIDSDYRGEVMCALILNSSACSAQYVVNQYDRIAQLLIVPVQLNSLVEVDKLDELTPTYRGEGGFGHTGNK